MMKKKNTKNLPLFWRIYIFTVTVIVILCCVFFVFLSNYLRGYEQDAAYARSVEAAENARAESERLKAEERRRFEEQDSLELSAAEALGKRDALGILAASADDAGRRIALLSLDVTPAQAMERFVADLGGGVSRFSRIISCNIGEYELTENLYSYLDSLEGEYTYSRSSDTTYSISKPGMTAVATLTASEKDGHKSYDVTKLDVTVPLDSYSFEAPENAVVTVNGKVFTGKATLSPITLPSFIPKSFDVPACADYTAEGFVSRPVIEAKIDGRDCAVVRYSDKTVFLTPSGDTYEKELHGTLFGLCGKYSDFVAGAFKFSELKPYLWRGTNLYKTLSEFDNRWYYNYDHIGNEGEKFTDFKVYSEDLVSFHAEYTQVLYDANNKVRFRIKIKLDVYAGRDKETGKWYLLDIQ